MNANNELIKKALRNSRGFIEGMMDVGGIPVTLCKLAADIHTQIQEAEKDINSSLESKATANEGKVREDVIKKAYIAGVEDCFVPLMVKTTMKMKIKLEELYANFKTANPSLFAEEKAEPFDQNIIEIVWQSVDYFTKSVKYAKLPTQDDVEDWIKDFRTKESLLFIHTPVDWVSTGQRPDFNTSVLVVSEGGKPCRAALVEINGFNKWVVDGIEGYLPYHYFTHWMPLPEFKKKGE